MHPIIIALLYLANAAAVASVLRNKPVGRVGVFVLITAGVAVGLLTALSIKQIVG